MPALAGISIQKSQSFLDWDFFVYPHILKALPDFYLLIFCSRFGNDDRDSLVSGELRLHLQNFLHKYFGLSYTPRDVQFLEGYSFYSQEDGNLIIVYLERTSRRRESHHPVTRSLLPLFDYAQDELRCEYHNCITRTFAAYLPFVRQDRNHIIAYLGFSFA